MRFVDYGIYGDGDLYESDANLALGYVARLESHGSYVAIKLHYTSQLIPGNLESFRVLRVSCDVSLNRPSNFTYEAFVDKVEATDQLSMILRHSGSEFVVANSQLITKMKRSKGKDV
jgi:hypothetical protein